jgi:uncharacterized iron-regulated membrane protein
MGGGTMADSGWRAALLKVHLWVGMPAALFLFALGLSGALLTFEETIDAALNARVWYVKPQGTPLKLTQITQAIRQAFPQNPVEELVLAQKPDDTVKIIVLQSNGRDLGIFVNPYTGEIVGRSDQLFRPMLAIREFHTHLLIRRRTGHMIQTIAACCLLGLAVTGIALWWPRKIFKLRGGPSHNIVFDLHQMLGLWSSACALLFALTGIAIGFEDQVNDWAFAVSHIQPAPWPMPKPPAAGVPPLSPDELLAKAASIAPGARPIVLDFGDSPNDPVLVIMKFPEDHLGRTHVILDRYTGDVLRFDNTRAMPVPLKYARLWNQEIHTGDIFGWPTRILACIFSLAVAALAVTGPWIWWNRNRAQRSRSALGW